MNISWGTKIAILYSAFVVMIISLVVASSRKKVDLVSDNYYQQEVAFQQQIDAEQARTALRDSVTLEVDETNISLIFPQIFASKNIATDIRFYAVVDGSADRSFSINTNNGRVIIVRKKLACVPYEIQVSWTLDKTKYYQAIPLNLK